jgi:hypothetical protein
MQNRRRQGIATSCGLARNEEGAHFDSDGRIGWRDYSYHCEEVTNLRILLQGREGNSPKVCTIRIYDDGVKCALQFPSSVFSHLARTRISLLEGL